MTIRFTSSRELAEDRESVDKLATCYWNIEQSNTPFSLLFPWLPSRARRLKESSTTALYSVLLRYVTRRRECGTGTDAIDILISQGETNETIVGVCAPAIRLTSVGPNPNLRRSLGSFSLVW